jgi:excinuclease ABC subunit C
MSLLDTVEGIGPVRRRVLVKEFGSVDLMRRASVEEFARLPGMTRRAAEAVYNTLHTGVETPGA